MFTSHTPLLEQYLTKLFQQNQIQKMKLKSQLQKAISSKLLVNELQQPTFWKNRSGPADGRLLCENKPLFWIELFYSAEDKLFTIYSFHNRLNWIEQKSFCLYGNKYEVTTRVQQVRPSARRPVMRWWADLSKWKLAHSGFETGYIGSKVLMVGSNCRTLWNISTFTTSGAYRYHTFPKNNR